MRKKWQIKNFFHLLSNNSDQKKDHLNATSCRIVKSKSDSYVNKCTRSFGIIARVTNCRIITSFSALYRLETLREIINLFATSKRGKALYVEWDCSQSYISLLCFLVAGQLAPNCIYDDRCHLVRHIKNHIGQDITKTPAMALLDATPISVDRSHFRNHVSAFCRRATNPDKTPCLCQPLFYKYENDSISLSSAEGCEHRGCRAVTLVTKTVCKHHQQYELLTLSTIHVDLISFEKFVATKTFTNTCPWCCTLILLFGSFNLIFCNRSVWY